MKLAEALLDLSGRLNDAHVPFAVVGGIAASAQGDVRFTRDVDVAVSVVDDSGAEKIVHTLVQGGFKVLASVEQDATHRLATVRLNSPADIVCDLIFATCGIEPEIVATAERLELFPGQSLPTARAECLVAMKVLSVTPKRPRDLADIQGILRNHPDLDRGEVDHLLRLISERGYGRGQDLGEKWRALRDSFT